MKFLKCTIQVINSIYFKGCVGWAVIAYNYPLTDILPRYAG